MPVLCEVGDVDGWVAEDGRPWLGMGSFGLENLKEHLQSIPHYEAQCKIQALGFENIIVALKLQESAFISDACDILNMCFNRLPDAYLKDYTADLLLTVLTSTQNEPRVLIINKFHDLITRCDFYPLPQYLNIAVIILKCMLQEHDVISSRAIEIIVAKDWLLNPYFMNHFETFPDCETESHKCKYYEVVIKAVRESPHLIDNLKIQNLLHKLIAEFDLDDWLFQANVLHLISHLSATPHGLKFLDENDVITKFSRCIESKEYPSVLLPGLLTFFGRIARMYPTVIIEKYPIIMETIFEIIHTKVRDDLPYALQVLGKVGETVDGKLALCSLGRAFTDSISEICALIKDSPDSIKSDAIICLQNLIEVKNLDGTPVEDTIDQRVVLMTREWFRLLSGSSEAINVLFEICKNPFIDIKEPALSLLSAVCQHEWGVLLIKDAPGLIEFILNRSTEICKNGMERKYEIVNKLSKTSVFDPATKILLDEYVKQGPFFAQAMDTAVAVEGE